MRIQLSKKFFLSGVLKKQKKVLVFYSYAVNMFSLVILNMKTKRYNGK